jgi:hypothetical protein
MRLHSQQAEALLYQQREEDWCPLLSDTDTEGHGTAARGLPQGPSLRSASSLRLMVGEVRLAPFRTSALRPSVVFAAYASQGAAPSQRCTAVHGVGRCARLFPPFPSSSTPLRIVSC